MKNKKGSYKSNVWGIMLAVGLVMLAVGISRGEMAEVFLKATNICLECIGIG